MTHRNLAFCSTQSTEFHRVTHELYWFGCVPEMVNRVMPELHLFDLNFPIVPVWRAVIKLLLPFLRRRDERLTQEQINASNYSAINLAFTHAIGNMGIMAEFNRRNRICFATPPGELPNYQDTDYVDLAFDRVNLVPFKYRLHRSDLDNRISQIRLSAKIYADKFDFTNKANYIAVMDFLQFVLPDNLFQMIHQMCIAFYNVDPTWLPIQN